MSSTDAPFPHEGPLDGADAAGESGSMSAGPGVRVAMRFDGEFRVAEIAFEVTAFPAARAVASALCRALLGATIDQASALSIPDLARMTGLPERSVVVRTVHFAKSAALLPHLGRRARSGPEITCTCFQVETATIRAAILRHRLTTVEDVRRRTKAGTGCGTCRPDLQKLIEESPRGADGPGESNGPGGD